MAKEKRNVLTGCRGTGAQVSLELSGTGAYMNVLDQIIFEMRFLADFLNSHKRKKGMTNI